MGDTELVHMSKPEIRGLASLGKITVNPDTGLPEAFNLKNLLPMIANVGLAVATGGMSVPAQMAIMGAANFGMGLLQGQDTKQALLGGAVAAGTTGIGRGLTSGLNAASAGIDSAGNVTQSSGMGFDYSLEGVVPPPSPSGLKAAVPVVSPPIIAPPPVPVAEPSLFSKALDLAKEYPKTTAIGAGLLGAGLMEGQEEEPEQQLAYEKPVERKRVSLEEGVQRPEPLTTEEILGIYTQGGGTQEQITSLQSPYRYVPKTTYASHGGLIGLAEGGAVQRFLDNGGDSEPAPSISTPSKSTTSAEYSGEKGIDPVTGAYTGISTSDKARTALGALGLMTGNPALTLAATALGAKGFFSNVTNPNVAVFNRAVPGQVQASPFSMFSSQAPQIAGMRADIATDVDGPAGPAAADMSTSGQQSFGAGFDYSLEGDTGVGSSAGSSGEEDSEMGNDDPMKAGGLIGLADGGMVTVQPGDTLTKIANETGMTVEGLQSLNNITNPNIIQAGQQLKISEGDSGLKISEGDSGLDIASIKENIKDFVSKLSNLPEEVRSGIMAILPEVLPEGMLESFNKPEVEDTTDSKQVEQSEYPRPPEMPSTISDMRVEQSDSNKSYFNDIVRPLEFGDEYYKKKTHFNPKTNSYKAYVDSEGYLTFGPGVRADEALKKLFKVQKFKKGKSELPRDEIDKIALKRWDKSIEEAKELTNLPDDKVKPFAEMVFQLGKKGVGKFKNMIKAAKEGDFENAAIHALDSKWARQIHAAPRKITKKNDPVKYEELMRNVDEEYSYVKDSKVPSNRVGEVANRIQALGFPARAKGGNIGHYFQGQVDGGGDGQSDNVPFKVDARSKSDPSGALLSVDEYVLPADVVSMMGNGSSNAGASKLDNFVKSVRKESFGTTKQQKPYNTERGLSALV
jgi:LysM repeat protein